MSRLADRLILRPSTEPLPDTEKSRREVRHAQAHLEIWSERLPRSASEDEVELFILKFPGTASRAERATPHPAEVWPERTTEVWAMNPPGYGGSPGEATLRTLAPAARLVYEELLRVAAGRPILVTGNSLGSALALHLGANYPVKALLLRNPPPLRQLIVRRHGWWNLWFPAWAVARQIPAELDSIRNAARCLCPALMVVSEHDQIVPPPFQRQIFSAYAGPQRTFLIPAAGHGDPIPESAAEPYYEQVHWLAEHLHRPKADA